jgi:hypothetical protein
MTPVMMMPVMVVTHCSDVGSGGGVGYRLLKRRDGCGLRSPTKDRQYEPWGRNGKVILFHFAVTPGARRRFQDTSRRPFINGSGWLI